MNAQLTKPQRQDSLHDQMRDVVREAERLGCYDAADWIKARWNGVGAPYEQAVRAHVVKGVL